MEGKNINFVRWEVDSNTARIIRWEAHRDGRIFRGVLIDGDAYLNPDDTGVGSDAVCTAAQAVATAETASNDLWYIEAMPGEYSERFASYEKDHIEMIE